MTQVSTRRTIIWAILTAISVTTARGLSTTTPLPLPGVVSIQGKESYVMRDGLRIYLWE